MSFKFAVGSEVEFKAPGERASMFKVVRQLPEEDSSTAKKYRIKSNSEPFERTVSEDDLSASGGDVFGS